MSAAQSWKLRVLKPSDLHATASVLAAAFHDNPTYCYMHPRVLVRAHDLTCFFLRNLSWRVQLNLTWVACDGDGQVVGTVTLEPPGGVPHSTAELLRHWVLPTLRHQGARTAARIARTDATFARHYRALSGDRDYWHVHAVAVEPGLQGRGVGTSLLAHALAQLDRLRGSHHAPVLLSTQRERNLQLYRKFGFELRN
ncbi:MAG TPA: GNAT family N-acetyltransferase, partial [Polyangiales bacterium]